MYIYTASSGVVDQRPWPPLLRALPRTLFGTLLAFLQQGSWPARITVAHGGIMRRRRRRRHPAGSRARSSVLHRHRMVVFGAGVALRAAVGTGNRTAAVSRARWWQRTTAQRRSRSSSRQPGRSLLHRGCKVDERRPWWRTQSVSLSGCGTMPGAVSGPRWLWEVGGKVQQRRRPFAMLMLPRRLRRHGPPKRYRGAPVARGVLGGGWEPGLCLGLLHRRLGRRQANAIQQRWAFGEGAANLFGLGRTAFTRSLRSSSRHLFALFIAFSQQSGGREFMPRLHTGGDRCSRRLSSPRHGPVHLGLQGQFPGGFLNRLGEIALVHKGSSRNG